MTTFAAPTVARPPRSVAIFAASLVLVTLFVVMAVAQLYSFEAFPQVLADYWLPGGMQLAYLLAALVVTFEVFAVPFLLGMRTSYAMRIVSMVAGWAVAAMWLGCAIWVNVTTNALTNAGLLGATIPLPVGWWMVVYAGVVSAVVIWVSWGRWPLGDTRQADLVQKEAS